MEIEVKLPELGDGIKSGDVLEVLVNVGDEIQKDQGLIEVETDKATVTLPSSHAGRIAKLLVKPGQTVPIGATVAVVEVAAGAAAAPVPVAPPAATAAKAAPPAKPAAPPAAASPPAASQPSAVSAKAAAPAPSPPPLAPVPIPSPSVVVPAAPPLAPAGVPSAAAAKPSPVAAIVNGPSALQAEASPADFLPAGPAVRRFAREVGVDLRYVKGTGPGERITREDVLNAVRQANQAVRSGGSLASASGGGAASGAASSVESVVSPSSGVSGTTSPAASSVPAASEPKQQDAWGPVRIEKLTKIRKTIAAKMHESWSTVPRVTNMDDADVTELERIRQASKDDYAASGIKLTALPFLIKSVAMALRKNPVLNASIDMESGTIIYKDYVNIGIAVDSDRGLVVPSLRNADGLSIPEIARQIAVLADKVRDNNFAIDDLRGSTFTISNLGAVGGTYATPIVNTPEVAILLVGRSRKLPVVVNDEILPRLMMPLSLSYDHRVVDGAAAARFLNDVIGYLKAPARLLLAP